MTMVEAGPAGTGATNEAASAYAGGRIERAIGRPAHQWTVEDLAAFARGNGIRLVSLMHVGGDGWLKTLDFVPRSDAHLRAILEAGERADGSSLFPGLGIPANASDVVLRPRPSTAFVDPFAPLPTLAVLCGHAGRDGQPLPQSPGTVLARAHARLQRETGVSLTALGEVEYFLGRRPGEADLGGAGDRGYHATAPFVFGEGLRRRALVLLAEIGVPVKYGHSEVGWVDAAEAGGTVWEQHEIELGLAPLESAADAVAITHWVLRNLAHLEGLRLNLDPVLKRGHAGTGMHFHFAPVKDGAPVPARGADGKLTDPARRLIGGLVRHGASLMAFGNRSDGSFVRLSQKKESPASVSWGEFDRSALVRLPIVARDGGGRELSTPTIEFRLPDGSAHAHLLLAGIAQAMSAAAPGRALDALLDATAAGAGQADGAVPGDGAAGVPGVPRGFREVAAAMRRDRAAYEAGGVFPAGTIEAVIERLEG